MLLCTWPLHKLNSVSCTYLCSKPPLCSPGINSCCYTANLQSEILKCSFLWSNVFTMMQHGNFCATSKIWTDIKREMPGGGENVIISTNFWVSLWCYVELARRHKNWGGCGLTAGKHDLHISIASQLKVKQVDSNQIQFFFFPVNGSSHTASCPSACLCVWW